MQPLFVKTNFGAVLTEAELKQINDLINQEPGKAFSEEEVRARHIEYAFDY